MVLLTLRWKGEPDSPELAVNPITSEVDIYAGDQNDEDYLEKNWKGQVRQAPSLERHHSS